MSEARRIAGSAAKRSRSKGAQGFDEAIAPAIAGAIAQTNGQQLQEQLHPQLQTDSYLQPPPGRAPAPAHTREGERTRPRTREAPAVVLDAAGEAMVEQVAKWLNHLAPDATTARTLIASQIAHYGAEAVRSGFTELQAGVAEERRAAVGQAAGPVHRHRCQARRFWRQAAGASPQGAEHGRR